MEALSDCWPVPCLAAARTTTLRGTAVCLCAGFISQLLLDLGGGDTWGKSGSSAAILPCQHASWFFWERFSNVSPLCFSWSCKCSSHHFYPRVLHQRRRVLCRYIPGGNNTSCPASPQYEEDRVGWQVCIQGFPGHFLWQNSQACGSSGLQMSLL